MRGKHEKYLHALLSGMRQQLIRNGLSPIKQCMALCTEHPPAKHQPPQFLPFKVNTTFKDHKIDPTFHVYLLKAADYCGLCPPPKRIT